MKLDEIQKIAEMMTDHDLTEFLIESDEMKLSIKRGTAPAAAPQGTAFVAPPASAPQAASSPSSAAEPPPSESESEHATINSPIVGTFYAAPAPDADTFVKVGDDVSDDTVVGIVEAMKVMNEIKAEQRGTIRRVLVENGTPVEYNQPLFEIDPA